MAKKATTTSPKAPKAQAAAADQAAPGEIPPKPRRGGGPTTRDETTPNVGVWNALRKLANARVTSKSRLADLIKQRESIDAELDQLGVGHTQKHLETSRQAVVTVRAIDWQRKRISNLSDRIDKILIDPDQLRLWEDVDEVVAASDPDEAALFCADGHQAEPADDTMAAVLALLPGQFRDQDGREYTLVDRVAFEEFVCDRVGRQWHAEVVGSDRFGMSINIRKQAGRGKVMLSLTKFAEVE